MLGQSYCTFSVSFLMKVKNKKKLKDRLKLSDLSYGKERNT